MSGRVTPRARSVRMHDLASLGRSRPRPTAEFSAPTTGAARRQSGTDAVSIATGLPSRPRAASSRPERTIPRRHPSGKLRRLLADERGYTLVELLQVTIILGVVMAALTALFVQASNAELDMNRRFQAQQEARVAVDRMRREIHCSSGIAPTGASASISVTIPGQCPTGSGAGGPDTIVTYRTVLVSTGRYKLERQVGTGPIARLADYIRVANVFTYYGPTQTSLGKLRVDLPINIQPPGSGSNWQLVADMVLRNTSRLP